MPVKRGGKLSACSCAHICGDDFRGDQGKVAPDEGIEPALAEIGMAFYEGTIANEDEPVHIKLRRKNQGAGSGIALCPYADTPALGHQAAQKQLGMGKKQRRISIVRRIFIQYFEIPDLHFSGKNIRPAAEHEQTLHCTTSGEESFHLGNNEHDILSADDGVHIGHGIDMLAGAHSHHIDAFVCPQLEL